MDKQINKIMELSDINTQRVKWFEELAELAQALAKEDVDNIVEEIADVRICIDQMRAHYNIDEMDIDSIRRSKLTRTIKRLTGAQNETRIKQCKVCGAPGILKPIPGSCDSMYVVECKSCNRSTSMQDSKLKAIEAWNKRE